MVHVGGGALWLRRNTDENVPPSQVECVWSRRMESLYMAPEFSVADICLSEKEFETPAAVSDLHVSSVCLCPT